MILNLKKHGPFFKYFLIPILLFGLFRKGINHIIEIFLVNPIFSYCYPANVVQDVSTVLVFFILISPIIKIINGATLPSKWYYIFIVYIIVFLSYRIPNHTFVFTTFSFSDKFKLLDLISTAPLIILIANLIFKRKEKKLAIENRSGFTVEEPIQINLNNDLYKRGKFIKEIASKIKSTSSTNASFPIGIIAAWGSGKTTFLNTLVSAFDETFIIIEFNVWKCKTTSQIIESFFKVLIEKLSINSFSIERQIKEYANDLIEDAENKNIAKSVFNILFPNKSLAKEYDDINEEIKKINRKIIVLIDDIDRLNKIEIYEVIRLIRNTANFSNTFFIVAYDRNYILNAIEEINPYQSHYFLEKIFQVEFTLPPIDFLVLKNQMIDRLNIFLSDESKVHLKKMFELESSFTGDLHLLDSLFILNMRDVIRFVNSFKLSYEFIKDEIFFPDFFNLELIKYKHPELFNEFYRNRYTFLYNNHQTFTSLSDLFYSLKKINNSSNGNNVTELELFLKKSQDVYKLTDNDIEILIKSFDVIFPQQNSANKNSALDNCNLSVAYPSMLDRYFVLGIAGMLSQIEFSKARNSSLEEFNNQIDNWCTDASIIGEVLNRFTLIKDFNNKDDFEKVICAIFHYANRKKANTMLSYNFQDLYNKLDDYGSHITNSFYKGDKLEYKNFVMGLFTKSENSFLFESNFIKYINSQFYSQYTFPIPQEDLTKVAINYLKDYATKIECVDFILWKLFYNCEQKKYTPSHGTSYSSEKEIPKEALSIMKRFMLSKDLDGFLLNSINIEPVHLSKFSVAETSLILFKSWGKFESILKYHLKKSNSKYIKEYMQFFEKFKEENYNVYVDFEFKIIPIEERIKLYRK